MSASHSASSGTKAGYTGPALPKDDLPALDVARAFVRTKEPLRCKGGPCVFGLYRVRGSAPGGDATFTLSTHLAGAVYKLTYRNKEFVNPVAIVGASMQTALVYDGYGEYNPTEAGCGDCDSFTERSSSKLLEFRAGPSAAYTAVQAAYFNQPGKKIKWDKVTGNKTLISDTVISKRIEFVAHGVADYTIGIRVPDDKYWYLMPEVLCVWNPRETSHSLRVLRDGTWESAPDGSKRVYYVGDVGRYKRTGGLAIGTKSGDVALGVHLLDYPRGPMWESPRYGTPLDTPTWRKWSITHRLNPKMDKSYRIPGAVYTWKIRMYFGDMDTVTKLVAAAAQAAQNAA